MPSKEAILADRANWCEKHWSMLNETEGVNPAIAAMHFLTALMLDRAFQIRCGASMKLKKRANPAKVTTAILELPQSPCCFLGDKVMAEVQMKARTILPRASWWTRIFVCSWRRHDMAVAGSVRWCVRCNFLFSVKDKDE